MSDNDIRETLEKLNVHLDHVAKSQFLISMAMQKDMENRTPVAFLTGTYGFNPGNTAGYLADWRALVPRNSRRKRITFYATNETLNFINDPNNMDINDLIRAQKNNYPGTNYAAEITLVAGIGVTMYTKAPIWCASLTGAGSTEEAQATISWIEEIYADTTIIPTGESDEKTNIPGTLEKLTPAAMRLDGDIEASIGRDGVR